MPNRREVIKGGIAIGAATVLKCESVAAALSPTQACGCPRKWPVSYGHTCTVHDANGKRWDAYTFEDVAAEHRCEISIVPKDDEWSCYCGRHPDDVMPVGSKCVWNKVSYEYDEWECECADAFRDGWLHAVTTDWHQMAADQGMCPQPEAAI